MVAPGPLQPPRSPSLSPIALSPVLRPFGSPSPRPLQPPISRSASPIPRDLSPPATTDAKWTSGDFTLVSSDNVKFCVPAYHIFSASGVIRAASDLGPDENRLISFTDDEIETSMVIRSFLRLVTTGQVATTADGSGTPSVSALRRLILFLRKWECPLALTLVLYKVRELLNQGISVPMYTFILGATADDVETCALALKQLNQQWNSASGFTDVRSDGTPGAPTVDPNNLPFALWQWIPQEYMWSLSRAWGKHSKDGTRLPEEFKRCLQIIKSTNANSHNRALSNI